MRSRKAREHEHELNVRLPDEAVLRLEQVRKQMGKESIAEVVAEAAEVFCEYQRTSDNFPQAKLSARNRDVLRLVADGVSNKRIASQLKISVKTVEFHRAQLMKKLGSRSIAGLVRYAIRAGVILP
jgi:DNA-binding NarL/FixJ family response regulator